MGDIAANNGGLQQGYMLRVTGEAPGAMVAENGAQEAVECCGKRDFGRGKGEALEIGQTW